MRRLGAASCWWFFLPPSRFIIWNLDSFTFLFLLIELSKSVLWTDSSTQSNLLLFLKLMHRLSRSWGRWIIYFLKSRATDSRRYKKALLTGLCVCHPFAGSFCYWKYFTHLSRRVCHLFSQRGQGSCACNWWELSVWSSELCENEFCFLIPLCWSVGAFEACGKQNDPMLLRKQN